LAQSQDAQSRAFPVGGVSPDELSEIDVSARSQALNPYPALSNSNYFLVQALSTYYSVSTTQRFSGNANPSLQNKKSTFVQSACSFAGSDSPDSDIAQIGAVVSLYDDTGRAFGAASRSLVALGNNVSRFAGPLGTALSSGQTAYQLYNGQYLDAAFSAIDFGSAWALSTAGPLGCGV
jgi:hypothetical protein